MLLYKFLWSAKGDRVGVTVMVKKLCEKMVEIRMCDKMVAVVLVFQKDVLRLICGYSTKWKKLGRKQSI